jgi:hypothetical protein
VERAKREERDEDKRDGGKDTVDLAPYRERARELVEALARAIQSDASQRLRALQVLVVQLRALIEDLTTVDAPKASVEPLRQLLAKLQSALGATPGVEALRSEAISVLEGFAGGKGVGSTSAKRDAFWKG